MTQEQKELFEKDPLVKLILETEGMGSVELIGGAVIDILEGRKPKDYDFKPGYTPTTEKLELEYLYETKTAKTFKTKDGLTIQFLKTNSQDFDFTISQSKIRIDYKKQMTLEIDHISFDNKILIPTEFAWKEKSKAINSLKRIPHWRKKGYIIADETYLSLLNVVGKSGGKSS